MNKNKNGRYLSLTTLLLICLLVSTSAFAHKVSVFAYVEDGHVFVEGYFADGKKALNSKVSVFANGDQLVFEGVTDEQGLMSFPLPEVSSDLKISLNAGGGHRGEYFIPAEELVGAQGVTPLTDATASEHVSSAIAESIGSDVSVDQAQIERMIKHAVAEAIKPLVRELAASQEHVSFTQKVAGIGYIFGVLGIFAYMTARKKEAAAKTENKT